MTQSSAIGLSGTVRVTSYTPGPLWREQHFTVNGKAHAQPVAVQFNSVYSPLDMWSVRIVTVTGNGRQSHSLRQLRFQLPRVGPKLSKEDAANSSTFWCILADWRKGLGYQEHERDKGELGATAVVSFKPRYRKYVHNMKDLGYGVTANIAASHKMG
ncbi:hypothetical protein ARMSODRAFT_980251 [Armillaria solidipes]|uniref:Uncharacterized protein n=1 Tax=Armillaria solidipes TaxID=1076256 RepID=A0A2H3AWL0_9AGAR|nr:hypothetical protein ARMSODRAFT_980251 [Armillaria solidipes]